MQGIRDAVGLDEILDSMRASMDVKRESRRRAQFPQLPDPEIDQGPRVSSRSWSTGPRYQTFGVLERRIKSFQRRSDQLEAKREEALGIRVQLKFLRNNYRQQHVFVDESQRCLNNHIDEIIRLDDFVTTRENLTFYYGRARGDYLGLQEQSDTLQALEDKLTQIDSTIVTWEAQLRVRSEKMLDKLRQIDRSAYGEGDEFKAHHLQGAATDEVSTDEDLDMISSEASSCNPLLEDYFDKAGDVGVHKSRLMELLKDQEERCIQRDLQLDQGVTADIPDLEFNLMCFAEREAADEAIRNAVTVREAVRARCLEAGLNPDEYRRAAEEGDEISEKSEEAKEIRLIRPAHFSSHAERNSLIAIGAGPDGEAIQIDVQQAEAPRVTETVQQWIESIDEDHIEPLLGQVAAENTSTKRDPLHTVRYRRELAQYLVKHGSAEVIARLARYGIDLPSSTREGMDRAANYSRMSISDRSRASSESRLSTLLRSNIHHVQLISDISGAARGC